ncbi:hypothetical protein NLA06_02325 [Desulfomicrobium sp. ZS1]|uniref:hypothetical protein n=1 Tax=Desulfomicrobium sp. ZS1 TaxID=2952228 RepID=UPI0020B32D9C|nr:hypothetical protein [Desulfomicrobium sp. ZS1]UTF51983.1 hypothetical protein NLA06_02325 [Desulfomicrobium sp. ZS1]
MRRFTKRFCRVASHAAGVRRAGAAALDLAYVAADRLDAFFVEEAEMWARHKGSLSSCLLSHERSKKQKSLIQEEF